MNGDAKLDNTPELLSRLRQRSKAGFAIALHVSFTTPKYLLQSYDKEWLDIYSRRGMVMNDPTVRWAFANNGAIRWSALAEEDQAGVLDLAAKYGMAYGVTIAMADGGSKSMASFARADREMSDIDVAGLTTDLRQLHLGTLGTEKVRPEIHEILRQLSIYLTHG